MSVTLNAKGTSVNTFSVGKGGLSLAQAGTITPPNGNDLVVSLAEDNFLTIDAGTNGPALITASAGQDLHINPAVGGGQYLLLNSVRWPVTDGANGQVLRTNGAGVLSFSTVSGTGTVTDVSVATANGISGTVATSDTTPAITLTLGNVTPSSVTTGAVTLSSLNTGQLAGQRNKIINGKMEIAQRGTVFSAAPNASYTLDRWQHHNNGTASNTISQSTSVPSDEFQNSLLYNCTVVDASVGATDYTFLRQSIEGYNVRDLIGRTFTLSFWVRSRKTGTHCVAVGNIAADRNYVSEYVVNAVNTWEKKTITITGGLITAGTWNWTNGLGLTVSFVLMCGSTFQTTPGAWQTGNFLATSNQVNLMDATGDAIRITGVQLEVGAVATPFEHRLFSQELALCQRYYETGSIIFCTTATPFRFPTIYWKASKRATPTLAIIVNGGSGATVTHLTSATGALEGIYQNAGNSVDTNGAVSANAEL